MDLGAALAGPPPHTDCRCTACVPEPDLRVRTDMLYGVPVLAKPYGVLSMAEGRTLLELERPPADRYVTVEQAQDYAQQVLDQFGSDVEEQAPGAVTADVKVASSQFSFNLEAIGRELAKVSERGLLSVPDMTALDLDTATVREAMRRAAADEEERVRYRMLTGEAPHPLLDAVTVKAAVDYYMKTGRLPGIPHAPAEPASPPPAAAPQRPRHRRAMKLQGRMP